MYLNADVVRFHGVEKFEDLRRQAKKGFGDMERDGRIGGEPVDDSFPIPLDQLQTYSEGGDTEGSYEEVLKENHKYLMVNFYMEIQSLHPPAQALS